MQRLSDIGPLIERYDGFLIDQWGVLHDGRTAYPGALDALKELRACGKKVVIISNSGRRSASNVATMEGLGFPRALWDDLVSAGEDAWRNLKMMPPGRRPHVIDKDGERGLLVGLNLMPAADVGNADFLLTLGVDEPDLAAYDRRLGEALRRDLLMVCANPDHWRFGPDGALLPASGALADRYEQMGGRVRRHGKPYGPIYETCLASLGLPKERVVAIGDSVPHDVVGAKGIGVATALITGGVHAEELSDGPEPEAIERLAGPLPDFVLPRFARERVA
jgi:HAD superfamily hydrolase (TIGR01459 family)